MREGGHVRWRIENNGFKELDEQTNCDHVYTHDAHAFLALTLMIFIGWDLLLLFNLEGIRKGYKYVKWTLDFLSELLKTDFWGISDIVRFPLRAIIVYDIFLKGGGVLNGFMGRCKEVPRS